MLFTTAGQLLNDLAALDSDSALRRRPRHYAAPSLLVVDEVGYRFRHSSATAQSRIKARAQSKRPGKLYALRPDMVVGFEIFPR